ncbi:MAG: NADH-quinone oxidoreductase subunit NuoF [Eubacterium sp.]|jgi:NADH-quinone oxidoreductase subunit F|nr:NADH-quinone oxidoreductase subunit NuoF [Eubacterium sp.]
MKITVGKGSCGIAAGAAEIFDLLEQGVRGSGVEIKPTGCIGMCYLEPIVNFFHDKGTDTYVRVDRIAANEILKLARSEQNNAGQYAISKEDLDILNSQYRIALQNCGIIDPESIEEYIEKEGYKAAKKCIEEMTPERVIEEIKISGLRGRGGAGFPTWFKWNAARKSLGKIKYMICNADEGDPGAFMDRAVIEGDPHAIIEGMIIGAYAIGATEGIVYVRAEYPLAITRFNIALEQARVKGILGTGLFGSGFNFDISIKAGAGAFVCGEETALIASLEGERGMPRLKPPFPAQKGYWQKPSNINNVETYANIPWIIRKGGQAFSALGAENSKGTKVFALTGKVAKGGLAEVPMGKTVQDVVYGIGGGVKGNKSLKAVQMGGPSGGCIPYDLIGTEIDYRSLAETGAIMGSGGMVIMDESTCMVDMARFFLDFIRKESCGKCTHCRVGTKRMLEILNRICNGQGREGDIELLGDLAEQIKSGSMCALGQSAPNPVLTTLKYFKNEYEDHVKLKKCTARQCKPLMSFSVNPEKCTGCTLCARKCPSGAITGEVKSTHSIDREKCVKCGICAEVCRFGAVLVE